MSDRCHAKDGTEYAALALTFVGPRCVLSSASWEVATLNTHAFDQLQRTVISHPLKLEGLLKMHEATRDPRSKRLAPAGIISVDLNVYGDPEAGCDVAMKLSQHGFFLQDPDYLPEGITYENPQCLKIPAHLRICESTIADDIGDDTPPTSLAQNMSSQALQNAEFDFDVLLDRFAQHNDLAQAVVDSRITTILLS